MERGSMIVMLVAIMIRVLSKRLSGPRILGMVSLIITRHAYIAPYALNR
jgi:hypothetical protein